MKNKLLIVAGSLAVCLTTQMGWASVDTQSRMNLSRDSTYERNLAWENSADKAVTPAKVIRWMRGLRGQSLAAPSRTEFQPIVNAHDGQLRVVGAIAYKF